MLVLLSVAGAVGAGIRALFLRPIKVQVLETERDVPIQVFGLGTVEAQILSKVGFEVAGTLIELHADYDDRVEAGAPLARLNSREQEARVAQAKAAVAQAESAIRQAMAAVEHAEATVTQKAQVHERRQQLVQRGNVSTEVAEDARAAYDMARTELTQARSAVETARASLEQAKAQAAFEEARLAKYALYAPYDAIVVSRDRELGSMLTPGEQLFTLVDPKTVWVLAYIDETKAGRVTVGQPAEVTLRSLADRRFAGRVMRIDIERDRVSEERKVYVRCNDCPADFHLGEQAEVVIDIAELAEARLVPQIAVTGLQG
ncbi:MAG TPA: HlyD family efflux transporter periplasmic adaptor subunit [Geminicoccaceae bacterium]|nr:HlyD family efflux transporter periplasmic adaptor subunit [Geminicoccaceae bacterium]